MERMPRNHRFAMRSKRTTYISTKGFRPDQNHTFLSSLPISLIRPQIPLRITKGFLTEIKACHAAVESEVVAYVDRHQILRSRPSLNDTESIEFDFLDQDDENDIFI
jgi:hypothetical protein